MVNLSAPLDKIITRLDYWNNTSDKKIKKLILENIRNATYDFVRLYLNQLFYLTEGVSLSFDTGFPKREDTWKKGLIAFNPPIAMELGERERIQIRISKDLHLDLLQKMMKTESEEVDSLQTGDVMIVRLAGDNFEIIPYDEEEQGVTDEGYTQWEFDVIPKSTGMHSLFVKAGIVYNVKGLGPAKKFFPVFEKKIEIKVDTWRRLASFATERWEFLISTFLIPGITWAWSRRKKKAKNI